MSDNGKGVIDKAIEQILLFMEEPEHGLRADCSLTLGGGGGKCLGCQRGGENSLPYYRHNFEGGRKEKVIVMAMISEEIRAGRLRIRCIEFSLKRGGALSQLLESFRARSV